MPTKVVRTEMSAEIQAGYLCEHCNTTNVVTVSQSLGVPVVAPTVCLSCGTNGPFRAVWGPHLEQTTEAVTDQ